MIDSKIYNKIAPDTPKNPQSAINRMDEAIKIYRDSFPFHLTELILSENIGISAINR
jgi:hypothetical protein